MDRSAGEHSTDGIAEILRCGGQPFAAELHEAIVDPASVEETSRSVEDGSFWCDRGLRRLDERMIRIAHRN
jgi:hypothetical protein